TIVTKLNLVGEIARHARSQRDEWNKIPIQQWQGFEPCASDRRADTGRLRCQLRCRRWRRLALATLERHIETRTILRTNLNTGERQTLPTRRNNDQRGRYVSGFADLE
ncbi:MAG: hypothetical protein DMF91_09110, partial [Acidobacteria bacterium]